MKCTRCKKKLETEVRVLYRTNRLGEAPAQWSCWACLTEGERKDHAEEAVLCDIIAGEVKP